MRVRAKALIKWAAAFGLLVIVSLNVVACFHARAMTHWSSGASRTPNPEDLSWTQRAAVLLRGVDLPRPSHSQTPAALGLPFDTYRFPNGQGDELEAWHVPSESSDVLFLVFHGYGASKGSMLPTAEALHQLGYGVLLVDFYGSGGSSGQDTSLGVREALDVAAATRFCRERWPNTRIVLYGQSMGGSAALRAIAQHGVTPDGLILEATFDRLLTTVKSRFRAMDLPATPFAQLLVFWGGINAGINGFGHNPVVDASAVSCPALVFHGQRDARVASAEALSVYEQLGGWKRYSEFDDAGHGLVVLSDRAKWAAEIRSLEAQVIAAGRSNNGLQLTVRPVTALADAMSPHSLADPAGFDGRGSTINKARAAPVAARS